jgi:hypothetical protein
MIIKEFAPNSTTNQASAMRLPTATLSRYPIIAQKEKQDEKKDYHEDVNYFNYAPPDADSNELEDALNEYIYSTFQNIWMPFSWHSLTLLQSHSKLMQLSSSLVVGA